jgi:hypothetical protein
MILIGIGRPASIAGGRSLARAFGAAGVPDVARPACFLHFARRAGKHEHWRPHVGKILIGVIIGVILMIWLLASCVGAIF